MKVEEGKFYSNKTGFMKRKVLRVYRDDSLSLASGSLMVLWQDQFGVGHCLKSSMQAWAVREIEAPEEWPSPLAW